MLNYANIGQYLPEPYVNQINVLSDINLPNLYLTARMPDIRNCTHIHTYRYNGVYVCVFLFWVK